MDKTDIQKHNTVKSQSCEVRKAHGIKRFLVQRSPSVSRNFINGPAGGFSTIGHFDCGGNFSDHGGFSGRHSGDGYAGNGDCNNDFGKDQRNFGGVVLESVTILNIMTIGLQILNNLESEF